MTEKTTDNRYAILRSIVDGEWLPAPLLDTRAEATAYMLGFDAACEALSVGASVLILDLSTGELVAGDLAALDDEDCHALFRFVAEAFGIDLGNDEALPYEPSQEMDEAQASETVDAFWERVGRPARLVNRAANQQIIEITGGGDGMLWGRIALLSDPETLARTPWLSGSAEGWEVG